MKLNIKSILKDKNVLRIVAFISLLNLLGYIMVRDMTSVVFFLLVGYLGTYFSKNMIVILLIAMFTTNFFALSKADVKSSVIYAFNSLDFSDLSINALVTSVEDSFLFLIFSTNSVKDCFVISDITLLPLVQQNNLHYLEVNF